MKPPLAFYLPLEVDLKDPEKSLRPLQFEFDLDIYDRLPYITDRLIPLHDTQKVPLNAIVASMLDHRSVLYWMDYDGPYWKQSTRQPNFIAAIHYSTTFGRLFPAFYSYGEPTLDYTEELYIGVWNGFGCCPTRMNSFVFNEDGLVDYTIRSRRVDDIVSGICWGPEAHWVVYLHRIAVCTPHYTTEFNSVIAMSMEVKG